MEPDAIDPQATHQLLSPDKAEASSALEGYEGVREINRGGMGAILRGHHAATDREVAIKVILPGLAGPAERAKFLTEARVTAGLEHPHVVPVHDVGVTATGEPYYTMKLVRGESAGDVLDRLRRAPDPRWSLPRLLDVFVKVCDALAFAHARGVIHRDLKPDNVMVGEFGEVLVMDWGLARVGVEEDAVVDQVVPTTPSGDILRTKAGTIMGTPAYMPPEQAAGDVDRMGPCSDIYSLGAILYEMLALTPPFGGGQSLMAVLAAVIEQPPDPPSLRTDREVPHELEAIALRALAKDPADRYPAVSDLRDDVVRYLEGHLVGAARYTRRERMAKWVRRHRVASAVVACVTLLVLGWLATRAVQHELELRRLRHALAGREPGPALAEARRLIADAPPLLRRKQLSPSLVEKAAFGAALEKLAGVIAAADAVLRRAPDDADARRTIQRALAAQLRIARLNEDYAVAFLAVERLRHLRTDVDHDALRRAIREDRDRRTREHLGQVRALLDRAREGRLGDEVEFRHAVVSIVSLRDRQLLDLLVARLEAITTAMRATLRQRLVSVATPTVAEARAGERRIVGLPAAVDRWIAGWQLAGDGPKLPPRPAALEDAFARLAKRERVATWTAAVGPAQREALAAGPGGQRYFELLCGALGQFVGRRAVRALAHHAITDCRARESVPAGIALALAARRDAYAASVLEGVAGLRGDATTIWGVNSPWWQTIAPLYRSTSRAVVQTSDFERAQALQMRGDLDGALAAYNDALAKKPTHLHARLGRGQVLGKRGDLDGALADLDHVIARAPGHVVARVNRAELLRTRGDIDGAIAEFGRALSVDPRSRMAWMGRGMARWKKRDYDGAIADLDRAVALDPRDPSCRINRGLVRLARGDRAGALADHEEAVRLAPDLADAYYFRGDTRRQLGDLAGALADLDRAVRLAPRDHRALAVRGSIHEQRGDRDAARRDLDRAVALAPDYSRSRRFRAQLRLATGDRDGALADLSHAIARHPADPALHGQRAQLHISVGNWRAALVDAERAIALAPGSATGYLRRGQARLGLGQLDGALADCDRAVALRPHAQAMYELRALVHRQRGDKTRAIADLDRVLAIRPKARAHFQRARCYHELGDARRALADVERTLALDPRHVLALNLRGIIRTDAKDAAGALADFAAAIRYAPSNAQTYINRGALRLRQLRDFEGAAGDARAARRLAPKRFEPLALLGEALIGLDRIDGALVALAEARALAPPEKRPALDALIRRAEGKRGK